MWIGMIASCLPSEKTATTTELRLEAHLQDVYGLMLHRVVELHSRVVDTYSLGRADTTESACALEASAYQRTHMMLARYVQRTQDLMAVETCQTAWGVGHQYSQRAHRAPTPYHWAP